MLNFFALLSFFITELDLNLFYCSAECQSKLRLVGVLRALINQLKEHVEHKEPAEQHFSFLEHLINTIGSAIAGHGRSNNVNSIPN